MAAAADDRFNFQAVAAFDPAVQRKLHVFFDAPR
jgi:hypothetical protein